MVLAFPRKTDDEKAATRQAKKASWAAAGICPNCGSRPVRPGRKNCGRCAKARDNFLKQRLTAWQAAERCTKCGGEPVPGRKRCSACIAVGRVRNWALYGLTVEGFDNLFAAQGRVCDVCGQAIAGTPVIDHDHASGRVRGIVHYACNTGLGMLGDTADSVQRAVDYLRRFENNA